VREALELMTFRLAADGLSAARADDASTARRVSATFHQRAVEIAGNVVLGEVEHRLRGRLRWLYGQHDDLLMVADEHVRLAEAVAEQEVETLPRLVSAHLETGHRPARGRRRGAVS
jgi:DNA-binding FadR family transcriptional regulator